MRRNVGLAATVCLLGLCPRAAAAQAIERNLPPVPQAAAPPVLTPEPLSASQDDRPIAGPLDQVVLLGPDDAVLPSSDAVRPGLDLGRLDRASRRWLERALKPLLGKPLSRRLIGEVAAEVVRTYRRAGRPFVSVTTPPQEVGVGRLQLRVVAYTVGQLKVAGAGGPAAVRIEAAVRAPHGQPVDADALSQDLDWLNRYPFRTVTAAFSPGAAPGDTDLTLTATPSRPFQVYAGYADSGSPLTGRDRYFAGALVGLPLPVPTLVTYQFTGSPDVFHALGDLVGAEQPEYLSHSARVVSFIAPRQDLELTVDIIQTSQTAQAFQTRARILEAVLGYRFALSNLWRPLAGDVVLGVEAKGETRTTYFGDTAVTGGEAEVYQLYGGWSGGWSDRLGHTALDVTLHVSPGRADPENSAGAFQAFSQGRVTSARYGYAAATLVHTADLPFGLSLSNELVAQYAPRALPDTEQAALGGASLVRGYSVDDGAFDRSLVLRNTLTLPWLRRAALGPVAFDRPFLFGDAGYGDDQGRPGVAIGAVGVGDSIRLGPVALAASLADPLHNGPATRAGRLFADLRLTAAY